MQKLAVLIDADNSSISSIGPILEEIAKYGIASVKRVYGDWSNDSLKNWRDILLLNAITPVQQFAYTVGKDATDMILIIDAMDLLYSGSLDGFCIVSSDSDFTPLASRIRESGLNVYGFGKKSTPDAFKKACDKFIFIENLITDNLASDKKIEATSTTNKNQNDINDLDKPTLNLIYKAVKDNADDSGWAYLGNVGTYISTVKPDFDTRNYGYAKLSGLIQASSLFETKLRGSQLFLRKLSFGTFVKLVHKAIANSSSNEWAEIDTVIEFIMTKEPDLSIKNYGFNNLKEAILGITHGWIEINKTKIKIGRPMPN
ncbi:NYN domain-containing protein [Acinetobacter entericus]|uniref:NYN domain-containing protein n=1 Tax=Acinetobacter entericus TaxID=2989714 RepID=A0ABT3NKQ2_9GAMM|nr:NYN domain-containing protein [Acinetobacter entericus]